MKKSIYILILGIILNTSVGYSLPFDNLQNSGLSKKEQKAVNKYQRKGDRFYKNNRLNEAIGFYEKAYTISPEDAKLNLSLAFCYYQIQYYQKALECFEMVKNSNQITNYKLDYYLARSYQFNSQFDTAQYFYKEYLKNENLITEPEKSNISKFIEECYNAKLLTEKKTTNMVMPFGSELNTETNEYCPVYSQFYEILLYTSRKENSIGGLKRFSDNDYFEDIFNYLMVENLNNKNLKSKNLNTRTNDAASGVTGDGKSVFVFRDENGGDLFEYEIKDNNFVLSNDKITSVINSKYYDASASTDSSKTIVYFISDRPEGNFGGKDIYISKLNNDSTWSEPQNIGNILNTSEDEISVFVSPNGKLLYFSSKGHNTVGGFDIFVSKKDSTGNWATPENIGFPINTPCDDVYYSQFDNFGYYATVNIKQPNGFDIYQVAIIEPIIEEEVVVEEVVEIDPDSRFGENYNLNLGKDSYLFNNSNFNLIEDTAKIVEEITEIVEPKADLKFYVNVEFETNSSEISKQSLGAMDTLAFILIENPDYKLVISGHTDNVGSFDFNQKLSIQRAESVANYLVKKGANKATIETTGYSFSKPLSTNETPEGRAKNRRVEFEFFKL